MKLKPTRRLHWKWNFFLSLFIELSKCSLNRFQCSMATKTLREKIATQSTHVPHVNSTTICYILPYHWMYLRFAVSVTCLCFRIRITNCISGCGRYDMIHLKLFIYIHIVACFNRYRIVPMRSYRYRLSRFVCIPRPPIDAHSRALSEFISTFLARSLSVVRIVTNQ